MIPGTGRESALSRRRTHLVPDCVEDDVLHPGDEVAGGPRGVRHHPSRTCATQHPSCQHATAILSILQLSINRVNKSLKLHYWRKQKKIKVIFDEIFQNYLSSRSEVLNKGSISTRKFRKFTLKKKCFASLSRPFMLIEWWATNEKFRLRCTCSEAHVNGDASGPPLLLSPHCCVSFIHSSQISLVTIDRFPGSCVHIIAHCSRQVQLVMVRYVKFTPTAGRVNKYRIAKRHRVPHSSWPPTCAVKSTKGTVRRDLDEL